ncbi:MAG TPA: hypothetical protein VNB23_04470, partial [Ramlibacter sp.]|nr:hypothetical protein [Ramlibacter sp.]
MMTSRNLGLGLLAGALLLAGCGGDDGGSPLTVVTPPPAPPAAPAAPEERSRPCTAETDSKPSSLGADGWAAAGGDLTARGGEVTGG